MIKMRLISIMVILPLLYSCAFKKNEESTHNNFVPLYQTGINSRDTETGLLVDRVTNNSPAMSAGIKPGDFILSANGKKLSKTDLSRLMMINKGEDVVFSIIRNGQLVEYDVTPIRISVPPSAYKIREILTIDIKKVNLAVIVMDVKNNAQTDSDRKISWETSVKLQHQNMIEAGMLNSFGNDKNFALIERTRLENILDEYKVGMTGLISDGARVQIGKMTGANYLLLFSYMRYPSGRSCDDVLTGKLIELESGKILSVDKERLPCEK